MSGKKKNYTSDDQIDRVGRDIVRASGASEADLEAIVSSPVLYAGLRARIASERRRREEGETWFTLLGVVWRSAPAMALVAGFAFVLFWSASLGPGRPQGRSLELLPDARDTEMGRMMFAYHSPMSSDEVLATILNDDEQEDPR